MIFFAILCMKYEKRYKDNKTSKSKKKARFSVKNGNPQWKKGFEKKKK